MLESLVLASSLAMNTTKLPGDLSINPDLQIVGQLYRQGKKNPDNYMEWCQKGYALCKQRCTELKNEINHAEYKHVKILLCDYSYNCELVYDETYP